MSLLAGAAALADGTGDAHALALALFSFAFQPLYWWPRWTNDLVRQFTRRRGRFTFLGRDPLRQLIQLCTRVRLSRCLIDKAHLFDGYGSNDSTISMLFVDAVFATC